MEQLMTQSKKCGCEESVQQKTLGMSTSGVNLMGSMNEKPLCAAGDMDNTDKLSIYEKPGYKLCTYVEEFIETEAGEIPVIKTKLSREDYLSTFLVRCSIGRYSYTVSPGLYAIGKPDKNSEVLVTANFKLTFDHLRKELSGISAWILVLDTKGINVWCAAGKGTFSTAELVRQIKSVSLTQVVDHRHVIVPQLGATGVSAREVKNLSGFRVIFGPVRAKDIPTFLKMNKKADKDMRMVTFSLYERFVLTPVELQSAWKPAFIIALVLFVISGLGPGFFSFSGAINRGLPAIYAMITGIFSGGLITPVLLPYIPSRTFALKGIITGSICAILFLLLACPSGMAVSGLMALFLFSVAISSYMAMNFTGCTPFTSPSGVEKEMKRFIPVQLAGLVLAFGLWIYSAFS
jgi:hypothetical protein